MYLIMRFKRPKIKGLSFDGLSKIHDWQCSDLFDRSLLAQNDHEKPTTV
jgi:hypothetical protein